MPFPLVSLLSGERSPQTNTILDTIHANIVPLNSSVVRTLVCYINFFEIGGSNRIIV
jgi:hypothetical protein